MTRIEKITTKQKRTRGIPKKSPVSSAGVSLQGKPAYQSTKMERQKKAKEPLLKKITRNNLEKRVRQQTD